MNHWKNIGPEWKTGEAFQIRELLRSEHIAFRMPFSDIFFTSVFRLPADDKRWEIQVKEKDRERAAALLVREGLASANMFQEPETAVSPAGRERQEAVACCADQVN